MTFVKTSTAVGLALSAVLLLSACSQTPGVETATPYAAKRDVVGAVVKAPLVDAMVDIFAVDSAGNLIAPALNTVKTDAKGQFSVPGLANGVFIARSRGGFFDDESAPADAPRRIDLAENEGFESLIPLGTTTVTITPFTHALVQKLRRQAQADGVPFDSLIEGGLALFELALKFDVLATIPANPAAPEAGASDDAVNYAMVLGGFAQVLNRLAVLRGEASPSYAAILAFIEDFLDGVVDSDVDYNQETARFRNNHDAAYLGRAAHRVDFSVLAAKAAVGPIVNLIEVLPVSESNGTLRFTGQISPPAQRTVEIDYHTTDGTATEGLDYTGAASGQLILPVGTGAFDILVPVLDDSDIEDVETLTLAITRVLGASLGSKRSLLGEIISDDSEAPPPPPGPTAPPGPTTPPTAPPTVTPSSNVAPIAANQQVVLLQNAIAYGVLTASDANSDPLSFQVVAQPANGTLILDGTTGNFSYQPAVDYFGTDSFTFSANDGALASNVATVTLTIQPGMWPVTLHFGEMAVDTAASSVSVKSTSTAPPSSWGLCATTDGYLAATDINATTCDVFYTRAETSPATEATRIGSLLSDHPVYLAFLDTSGAVDVPIAWSAATPTRYGVSGVINAQATGAFFDPVLVASEFVVGKASQVSASNGRQLRRYIGGNFNSVYMVTGAGAILPNAASQALHPLAFPPIVDDNLSGEGFGGVYGAIPDGDGGFFVGGSFVFAAGKARNSLLHMDATGQLFDWNPSWPASSEGPARLFALDQTNGVLFVASGGFVRTIRAYSTSTGNAVWASPVTITQGINAIAYGEGRLFVAGGFGRQLMALSAADGSIDPNWDAAVAGGAVRALAFDSVGKVLYAGGDFTEANSQLDETGAEPVMLAAGSSARNGFAAFGINANLSASVLPWNPGAALVESPSVSEFAFGASSLWAMMKDSGDPSGYTWVARAIDLFDPASPTAAALGASLSPTFTSFSAPRIGLDALRNQLYIAGNFTVSESPPARRGLVAYDLSALTLMPWAPILESGGDIPQVVAVSNGNVFVGGEGTLYGGGAGALIPRADMAAFDLLTGDLDPNWTGSSDGEVRTLVADQNRLYVGGKFTCVASDPNLTGCSTQQNLAALDLVSGGLQTYFSPGGIGGSTDSVNTTLLYKDVLYVGGTFSLTDSSNVIHRNLAAISTANGTLLESWAPSVYADSSATGAVERVNSLAIDYPTETIFVGGVFNQAGYLTVGQIADVVQAHQTLAAVSLGGVVYSGWNASTGGYTWNFLSVDAVKAREGSLIAGGWFYSASGGGSTLTTTSGLHIASFTTAGLLQPNWMGLSFGEPLPIDVSGVRGISTSDLGVSFVGREGDANLYRADYPEDQTAPANRLRASYFGGGRQVLALDQIGPDYYVTGLIRRAGGPIAPSAYGAYPADGQFSFDATDGTTASPSNYLYADDDYDGDGLLLQDEIAYGTSTVHQDTDEDGLTDNEEILALTNPLVYDTDGDGFSDGDEIANSTDPLDANDPSPAVR